MLNSLIEIFIKQQFVSLVIKEKKQKTEEVIKDLKSANFINDILFKEIPNDNELNCLIYNIQNSNVKLTNSLGAIAASTVGGAFGAAIAYHCNTNDRPYVCGGTGFISVVFASEFIFNNLVNFINPILALKIGYYTVDFFGGGKAIANTVAGAFFAATVSADTALDIYKFDHAISECFESHEVNMPNIDQVIDSYL